MGAHAGQLGSAGEVWAQRFTMPGADSARWDVFRPDGICAGRVMVPASFQVWEIGRDDVLGIARDELDVERVQVYRLGGVRGATGTEAGPNLATRHPDRYRMRPFNGDCLRPRIAGNHRIGAMPCRDSSSPSSRPPPVC